MGQPIGRKCAEGGASPPLEAIPRPSQLDTAGIIVTGGPSATAIANDATRMIPIVMAGGADPVTAGFVASIARPGGNITGLSALSPELSGKRIELLKEVVPKSSRLAVIATPKEPGAAGSLRETEAAARALGLQHQLFEVQAPGDLEGALEAAGKERAALLTVLPDPIALFHRARVVALVAKNRLPAIYWDRVFAEAGGLMAYGPDPLDLHRRAATYVDKILKGAKPGDLPVEQPTKFELVVNLKTAKALGLTIPQSVLLRADEVIQ
jgi:putative tryptophan/tyrosine transport system substrate-binding protein